MTLEEFINTYNGTSVGSGQCVALIKQYQIDVLGTSAPSVRKCKRLLGKLFFNTILTSNI